MLRSAGFSLVETLIAAGLLVTIALGTAQLFATVAAHNFVARQQLIMGLSAAAKIDELSAAMAAAPAVLSPSDSLERSADGWVETIVASGRVYVRRWRIAAVPGYGTDAYSIAVRVLPASGAGGDVRLTTIRAAAP